jgi:hypothetical protein
MGYHLRGLENIQAGRRTRPSRPLITLPMLAPKDTRAPVTSGESGHGCVAAARRSPLTGDGVGVGVGVGAAGDMIGGDAAGRPEGRNLGKSIGCRQDAVASHL